jgi:hypothetical protein
MWFAYPSPRMYATSTRMRSAFGPSGSSHQRTVSHATSARPTRLTVYTFSLTTDWLQTVKAVAPMSAASEPPTIRCHRCGNQLTSTRSVIRNHMPADTALDTAARMLTRAATEPAMGSSEKKRPINTKNGLPGGCGMPRVYAAAMYSLVSHIAVDGARVMRYSTRTRAEAMPAAR